MGIKVLAYIVLFAGIGLLMWNFFHLNFDKPEKVSIINIISNILIIVAMILTIIGQKYNQKLTRSIPNLKIR